MDYPKPRKAEKTKVFCAQVVQYLLNSPILLEELKRSKLLPIKIMKKGWTYPKITGSSS
jgi:RNA polymerase sigma factor